MADTYRLLADRYERLPGRRIRDIDDSTQNQVVDMVNEGLRRGYSALQIANGVESENYQGVASIFDDPYRSERISRTEAMFAFNWGAGNSLLDSGVTAGEAMDGSDDPECAERDGKIFALDLETGYFVDDSGEPVEDHPNGTLAWAPVIVPGTSLLPTGALAAAGAEEADAESQAARARQLAEDAGVDPDDPSGVLNYLTDAEFTTGVLDEIEGANVDLGVGLTDQAIEARRDVEWETKYSPDQQRDEHGRFGPGMGGAGPDTAEEKAAILAYQGSEYGEINGFLRGDLNKEKFPQSSPEFWNELHAKVDAISSAMTPLPTDQTVYRSIGVSGAEQLLATAEANDSALQPMGIVSGNTIGNMQDSDIDARLQTLVGATIEDKAFISTTTDKEVADAKSGVARIMFRINIPAGTMAVDLNAHPEIGDNKYAYEHEVLLDRDQKFRVDGIDMSSAYGVPIHVVSLSVVR